MLIGSRPAALRPMPERIDVHEQVPLPLDAAGKASCLECRTQLADVKHHKNIVEDLIPAKVIATNPPIAPTERFICPMAMITICARATSTQSEKLKSSTSSSPSFSSGTRTMRR